MRGRIMAAALTLAAGSVLVACGGAEEPAGQSESATESGSTSESEATSESEMTSDSTSESSSDSDDGTGSGDGPTVMVSESTLGEILVDGEGRTLYVFTKDSAGQSVCTGDCLVAWPALEGEPVAGEDVQADLLGSFEREDGTIQASYAEWPLYYFAKDEQPGDIAGQGVGEVWYVLSPEGEMITEMMSEGGSSGY